MKYLLIATLIISTGVSAQEADISEIFSEYSIDGSIVLAPLHGENLIVHNPLRAKTKYTVASTFKIPNTLIALQEKIVSGKEEIFKWDGKKRDIAAWNQDLTLESAFRFSCVWCYKQIARKVGRVKYQQYINTLPYGSLPESFEVDNFWLDGSLKLSAIEQVEFLKRLYTRKLPFDKRVFASLKEIMLEESQAAYSLYAKTGWAPYGDAPVGWYVGYIESADEIWFFATNLAIKESSDLFLRKEITRRVLQVIGLLPNT